MGNIATIKFNTIKDKWEAFSGTTRITGSIDLEYVKNVLTAGTCRKAVTNKITGFKVVDEDKYPTVGGSGMTSLSIGKVSRVGTDATDVEHDDVPDCLAGENVAMQFDINQRFEFLYDLVKMVITGTANSLIVTGEGGLGKTHTVMHALTSAGMRDVIDFGLPDVVEGEELVWSNPGDYAVVKGFSTAKGLYRTLYENRNKVLVFDDCDSVLKDKVAVNILKAALDSYDKRYISWMSEGSFGGDDLPRVFEFTGRVVFISNLPQNALNQAIKSRSLRIDLSMTAPQKIDRMEQILPDVLPEYDMQVKLDALEFLREHAEKATDLNIRTLMNVAKIRMSIKKWEALALYTITA